MNRQKSLVTSLFVIIAIFFARTASAQTPVVWYVDAEAAGGNGQSWGAAFNDLQGAITASVLNQDPAQQIWVKRGTYKPGNDRSDVFTLKPNVKVFGALAGTENPQNFDPESDPSSRDSHLLLTCLAPAGRA